MTKTKELEEDIKLAGDIEHVADTKGGKHLIDGLTADIVAGVDTLAVKHPTLTLQEFVAISADIKTRIDLLRALTRAKKTKESLIEMLGEALGT